MPQNLTSEQLPNQAAADEVAPETKVREEGEIVVKAENEATQATDVKPMHYVLGVGLGLVVVGMAFAFLAT